MLTQAYKPTGGTSSSQTARPTNTGDNQMTKGKLRKPTNRNQGYLAISEQTSPTTAGPGYPNKLEKQELDLKLHFMMLIEDTTVKENAKCKMQNAPSPKD